MLPQFAVTPKPPRARWLLAALLVGTTLAGCKTEQEPAPSSPQVAAPTAHTPATEEAGPAATPTTAPVPPAPEAPAPEPLVPSIRELAAENALPTQIVLELSRNVRPAGYVMKKGTVVSITPDVPGTLSWSGPSTLVFTPSGTGFAHATAYTVVLQSVETDTGVLKPPAGSAWSYRFTTPAFRFVQLSPRKINLHKHSMEVDVVFSGPVDLDTVPTWSRFQVDEQPISSVHVQWRTATGSRNVLTAQLDHPGLEPDATLRFTLKEGMPASKDVKATAPAGEASLALRAGKRLEVTGAYVQEGSTGSYLEVYCRDEETDGAITALGSSSWGSRGSCMLDEAVAAEAIHLKPAVKFSLAPTRHGFRLFGDFKRGPYSLRIDAGALSLGGGLLMAPYTQAFSMPARRAQLSFASSGRYLPRSAWRNLPLQHLNVDSVELTLRHVPPENLVFWMSNEGTEYVDARTSNVLVKKTLPLRSPPDALTTTYVDVASLVPADTRGLVEVSASQGGTHAASRILLTDLSLVAKRGGPAPGSQDTGEVWVWALGMESTVPQSGVEVSLVKRSGQAVARCTTRGEDGCRLQVPAPGVDDSEPFALIARKGSELTYLKYSELKTELANSDVQGEPYRSEKPYRASLWSDRGVYRPGDTAHLAAVLRGQDSLAPPAGLPVEVVVVDPRERELKKVVLKTNEAGVVTLDVRFQAFQDTGSYRATLKVADREVATYGFSVEEFVPERMKVTARAQKASFVQGEEAPVEVAAEYLFGGSAEGSPVELTCRLVPSEFKPKENAQYTYGVWRQDGGEPPSVILGQVQGTLDAKGRVVLGCPAQASAGGFRGPARLSAQASVFESGSGRSTVGEASAPVHPAAFYLGLQASMDKVKAGKPFSVKGVVVDWSGRVLTDAKAPGRVEVEYFRLEEEYGYYFDESEGYESYRRYLRSLREGRATVAVQDGRFTLDITPAGDAAGYLVRVKAGAVQTDLELEGEGRYYWWGYGSRVDQTPRPRKPASLRVELPARARVGEPVAVKLKAPYTGRVLFTAETDRVLTSEWVVVEKPGEVAWRFTPDSFAPNVYVSAFLVKDPHLESAEAFMPDRAFGVASVTLEPVDYTQELTLSVPDEVRSNDTLTVDLSMGAVEGPTFALVSVVDEGILSLTRYPSPDPLQHLFTRRALGVDTFETVGWTLLMPPGGNSRSTGGDGGGGAGRVQPVKPVALWSGLVPVPADGRLRVPFTLPQYRGAVRVMAVTAGPRRIGRASVQVRVRDPLVLQTTLPRFLTQNDEVQVPVFVTNLSGKAQDVKVTLSAQALPVPGLDLPTASSPLQLLGKSEGRARLADGKSTTFVFQAKAVQAVGAARLTVTAEGGGHLSRESLDVPLTPAGPRERRVQQLELPAGTRELLPHLTGWVPTTEQTTVWVTTNPYGESFQHLSYLVGYPYGCIEQTTSSTRPLLFISDLVEAVDPALGYGRDMGAMVQAGIDRILSMQTPSGGFGYWPGASEPVAWGTAYATHLLLDARKLKYPVPQDRLDGALKWMAETVTRHEGGAGLDGDSHDNAEAYLHYVLALGGKGRKARAQKLVEGLAAQSKQSALSGSAREQDYLLKASLWLAGDRRYEKELRNPDVSPITDERSNNWSFYSDRRRRGLMLSTFQDLFGNDLAGERLAVMVAGDLARHGSGYYTTQELVWGITGLGKRLHGRAARIGSVVLTVDGKEVAPRQDKQARPSDRTWAVARASERKSLQLELKTEAQGKVFLLLSSQGVRVDAKAKGGGEGLHLRRRWRKPDGTQLSLETAPVALADLVYVELELTNNTAGRVQNIALVDRLPAGWEIENARLGRGGGVSWTQAGELWAADYVNIRDDRMEVFGSLEPGESRKVVYAVRAVTAGTFTLPSAEAEAMYDPRIWAREAPGTVQVSGPWKDQLL